MTAAAFQIVAFTLCSFIAVAGALGMTTTMSMFRSGIFLMASFMGVAGLFILLSADLLGLLQIMMYIGGLLVMILFMVLFMHDPGGAMMASMPGMLAPIERWFSKGLTPRQAGEEKPAHPGPHRHGDAPSHGETHHATQERVPAEHAHRHAQSGPSPADHQAHDEHHGGHGHPEHHGHHKGVDHAAHGGHQDHGPGTRAHSEHADHGGMDMSMVTPVRRAAAWLAGGLTLLLVGLLLLRPAWPQVAAVPDLDSPRRIGELLMGKYMIAFEGAGTLILIGIFGAVLLARPSFFPDDPARAARVAVAAKPPALADEGLGSTADVASHDDHHGAPEKPRGAEHHMEHG